MAIANPLKKLIFQRVASTVARLLFVVKAARAHEYVVLIGPIYQPVFLRDAPRPPASQVAFEQLWLASALKRVTLTLL